MIAIGSFDNLRMNNLNIIGWEYIVQSPLSFCSHEAIIGKGFCCPRWLIIWWSTWLELWLNLLEWDCIGNEIEISRDKKILFSWLDILRKILYLYHLGWSLLECMRIREVYGCNIEKFSLWEEHLRGYAYTSLIRIIITSTLSLSHEKIFWILYGILRENSIPYWCSLLIRMSRVIGVVCVCMLSNIFWNINSMRWFRVDRQFL